MVTTYIIDHNQPFLGMLGGVDGGQKGQKGVKHDQCPIKLRQRR